MNAKRLRIACASIVSLSLAATPALAGKANTLNDLVGAKGGSGEMALEQRGFVNITGHTGNDAVYTYWWNARDKNCVMVKTQDGRYAQIKDSPNHDCNQKDSGGGGAGGVVAGALVGGLLVAALTHKSGHHDDNQHMSDQMAEQQYERGYNDGLHNTAYHNYDKNDAYASGYQAGVDQRARDTSYHAGRGGYAPAASLTGIQGQNSVWAIDEMSSRGFRSVDSFTSGNTQYGVYFNSKTRQCVQVTYADGKVYDIREIGTHPKCR